MNSIFNEEHFTNIVRIHYHFFWNPFPKPIHFHASTRQNIVYVIRVIFLSFDICPGTLFLVFFYCLANYTSRDERPAWKPQSVKNFLRTHRTMENFPLPNINQTFHTDSFLTVQTLQVFSFRIPISVMPFCFHRKAFPSTRSPSFRLHFLF